MSAPGRSQASIPQRGRAKGLSDSRAGPLPGEHPAARRAKGSPVSRPSTSRRACAATALALTVVLLSACPSGERVPDWSISAVGHMERFTEAYLQGDARVAAREFELARADTARTGQPERVARIELARCAARVASLDFEPCTGFDALRQDSSAAELAYASYLAGEARGADAALLPPQHRAIATGGADVAAIQEPLARLVAAGVLLRQARANPAVVEQAVQVASRQGWRRPLLAWLGVQARLAQERGDRAEVERLQRRMDLVQPARH